jgi:serine/threonine protein kinase
MAAYKDIRKIGSGGFGEVWECKRIEDSQHFAKKELKTYDAEAIKRFAREVRILSSLDHPNIIKIIGKRLQNPPFFYVSPLYQQSLFMAIPDLNQNGDRIYKIFLSVLNGIEYAHSQGVIHRDLKPENVLLNNDDDIVISDFGLGREFDSPSSRQTQIGHGLGTPFYMAPEQLRNARDADERSDIFSLGRILYELYIGSLCYAIQDNSKLPPPVQIIVSRCTKENPDERYQTVSELKQDWMSLFDFKDHERERSEFLFLQSCLSMDSNVAKRYINLFSKYTIDPDSLHDNLMKTSPEVLQCVFEYDSDFVRRKIKEFSDFTANQGWGFNYTDKIGSWCKNVFKLIDDPEIKTDLATCVLEVGVSHNRFNVMSMFSFMIENIQQGDEVLLMKIKLTKVADRTREQVISYIRLGKISESLRSLFMPKDEQLDEPTF